MKPEWSEFLINAGAELQDSTLVSFGNIQREQRVVHTGLVMSDLSHYGLIAVYGNDAADFLQGQLTNDIRDVSEHHSQMSAYCTHKGRMMSNFRLFRRSDTFYLRLPQGLLEDTLKRLQMFVLMSKVTIEDNSDALVHFGVSGPDARERLASHISTLPENVDDVSQSDGYTVIILPGIHPRYEIYGELDAMKKLWSELDVHAAPVGAGPWELLDILAGVPTIYPDTSEMFVPQMANMQFINGVSFQKGCYSGQEVIARTQYLGKLKRRMYRVKIETSEPIKPGAGLFAANSTSSQGTGNIVTAQADPQQGHMGLAVIDINDAASDTLRLYDEQGPRISLLDLPYSVESEAS